MKQKIFSSFVWVYLFLNIVVILGGAVVRATGSGDGCGASWPLCQGDVLPNFTLIKTIIEFLHRASSGIVGVGSLILVFSAFSLYPAKHIIRFASLGVLWFVILEGLLGAGLVVFGLVGTDASIARIVVMGLHLVNTFLLLGAITFLGALSSNFEMPEKINLSREIGLCGLLLLCLLITGATGAMTALSDTLFLPKYVGENLIQDISNPLHVLHFLRIIHPFFAIVSSVFFVFCVLKFWSLDQRTKIFGRSILFVIFMQILTGVFNLSFLTPLPLQLIHLFLADIVWILAVLYVMHVSTFFVQKNHS